MKGVPESPQCGFSSLAVRFLQLFRKFFNVFCNYIWILKPSIDARNILEDQELKNAVKSFLSYRSFHCGTL